MSKKIFVGGLSWGTTSEALRQAFEACGAVDDATVVMDRQTGQSRGFGFVTLTDPSGTAAAIEQMNGYTLDGRSLRVSEAADRSSRPRQ